MAANTRSYDVDAVATKLLDIKAAGYLGLTSVKRQYADALADPDVQRRMEALERERGELAA